MTITVRLADIRDIDGICRVEDTAFDTAKYHTSSRASFRHLLTRGNADILVAKALRDRIDAVLSTNS